MYVQYLFLSTSSSVKIVIFYFCLVFYNSLSHSYNYRNQIVLKNIFFKLNFFSIIISFELIRYLSLTADLRIITMDHLAFTNPNPTPQLSFSSTLNFHGLQGHIALRVLSSLCPQHHVLCVPSLLALLPVTAEGAQSYLLVVSRLLIELPCSLFTDMPLYYITGTVCIYIHRGLKMKQLYYYSCDSF